MTEILKIEVPVIYNLSINLNRGSHEIPTCFMDGRGQNKFNYHEKISQTGLTCDIG